MYTLNGILIEDYGIIPSQIEGSNIAISGAWDMPSRIGKIYHDWGDEDGIEPYLRADEIFFGGRDINFYGFMKVANREECLNKLDIFYEAINSKELIVFNSPDFGEWNVYINSEVRIDYDYQSDLAQIWFSFREPKVLFDNIELPPKDTAIENIDGYSWKSLGVFFLSQINDLNRPIPKQTNFTAYGSEGYKVGCRGFRELAFRAIIVQPNYIEFKTVLNRLYKLLGGPYSRIIQMKDGTQREVFVKDGFKVNNVNVSSSEIFAELEITFLEIKQLQRWNKLIDSTGQILVDNNGVPLIELLKGF